MKNLHVLTGNAALSYNGLINGSCIDNVITDVRSMDGVILGNIKYEYYHFKDDNFLVYIKNELLLPTIEKSIVDTIVWLPENCNEGELIEALQTYRTMFDTKLKLYTVADIYRVPHEFIDYWWQESNVE